MKLILCCTNSKKALRSRRNIPPVPYFLAHLAAMAPDLLLMFLRVNKGHPSKKTCWNFQALPLAVTPSCISVGSPPCPAGWSCAGSEPCRCLHKENSACYKKTLIKLIPISLMYTQNKKKMYPCFKPCVM